MIKMTQEEKDKETRIELNNLIKKLEQTQLVLTDNINLLFNSNLLIQIIKLRQDLIVELNRFRGIIPAE